MISKEDLKQEIEYLDSHYFDLVFRLLQQFPHQKNIKSRVNPLDNSRPIHYVSVKDSGDLAFTNVADAAKYGKQLRSSLWQRNNNHD